MEVNTPPNSIQQDHQPSTNPTPSQGAGNIGQDDTTYVDANIIREGPAGESHRGEYSSGRGGAGNIVNSPAPAAEPPMGAHPQVSDVIVPEPATREHRVGEGYADFHTGRGGEGNVHRERFGGHSKAQKEEQGKEGFGGKLKEMVGLGGKGGKEEK